MQEVKKPPLSVEGQRRLFVCMTDNLARYRGVRSLKKEQSKTEYEHRFILWVRL